MMVDREILSLADRQIQLANEQQGNDLIKELANIRADAAKRGCLRSGGYILSVQEACANLVTERAKFVWDILFRCITTVGVVYDEHIEQQLKSEIEKHFPESMNGLRSHLEEAARITGMSDILSNIPDKIGDARLTAIRKIHTEIDLFLMTLKVKPTEPTYMPPQINIHNSNIGALQTGAASVANVTQQVDTQSFQEVVRVLTQLQTELSAIESFPHDNKFEIIELVEDGIVELKKEKPNLSKIKSFITTIGGAISLTADLKPAYEALKTVSAMIGLTLP